MTNEEKRGYLKIDIGITSTARDEYLDQLLSSAADLIKREGIALNDSAEDAQLQIMYAAYLYRIRISGSQGAAAAGYRALRWALNNRVFSQKAGGETEG